MMYYGINKLYVLNRDVDNPRTKKVIEMSHIM